MTLKRYHTVSGGSHAGSSRLPIKQSSGTIWKICFKETSNWRLTRIGWRSYNLLVEIFVSDYGTKKTLPTRAMTTVKIHSTFYVNSMDVDCPKFGNFAVLSFSLIIGIRFSSETTEISTKAYPPISQKAKSQSWRLNPMLRRGRTSGAQALGIITFQHEVGQSDYSSPRSFAFSVTLHLR